MSSQEESRKGNPVAQIIHSLKLDTNQITLQVLVLVLVLVNYS